MDAIQGSSKPFFSWRGTNSIKQVSSAAFSLEGSQGRDKRFGFASLRVEAFRRRGSFGCAALQSPPNCANPQFGDRNEQAADRERTMAGVVST